MTKEVQTVHKHGPSIKRNQQTASIATASKEAVQSNCETNKRAHKLCKSAISCTSGHKKNKGNTRKIQIEANSTLENN